MYMYQDQKEKKADMLHKFPERREVMITDRMMSFDRIKVFLASYYRKTSVKVQLENSVTTCSVPR